jgi:hypothetical protein
MLKFGTVADNQEKENLCVVRVKTSVWADKKGLHTRRDVLYMNRLSSGYNILQEEMSATNDAEYVAHLLLNLNNIEDGLYAVQRTNCSHDFETGYIDSYDFKLVPFSQ